MGSFAALFLGTQAYLASERDGVVSCRDTAADGAGSAGTFGLLLPRGLPARAKGLALGLCLGAGLGAPLGLLQQTLTAELMSQGGLPDKRPAVVPRRGAAVAAIAVLSVSLPADNSTK